MAVELVQTLWGPEYLETAPMCSVPGCTNRRDNAGYGNYHAECSYHHKKKYGMSGWDYKKYRKDYCENIDGRLGFKCTSTIMNTAWNLEVDHIDGDRTNNHESNLQTLCNCCHRYKTFSNEENLKPEKRTKRLLKLNPAAEKNEIPESSLLLFEEDSVKVCQGPEGSEAPGGPEKFRKNKKAKNKTS